MIISTSTTHHPDTVEFVPLGWYKTQNDHNLSLRFVGKNRAWAARYRMTIICLCVPPDTIAYGRQKAARNDNNLSSPTSRLTVFEWQRAQNLSLRIYHPTCEIWMTKGAEFVSARLSPASLLLNDKGRRLCLCAFTHSACCSWMINGTESVSARLPTQFVVPEW